MTDCAIDGHVTVCVQSYFSNKFTLTGQLIF